MLPGWKAWIWENGGYEPCETVPITDIGFRLGYSAFETVAFREGKLLFWQAHVRRLMDTVSYLGIRFDANALDERFLIPLLDEMDGMLRVYVTGGDLMLSHSSQGRLLVIFETRPFLALETYQSGWRLGISSQPHHPAFGGKKSGSYGMQLHAYNQSHSVENKDDVLLFNEKKELISSAFSNVFVVVDQQILSPPQAAGARDGVVREWVMKHFQVREEIITKEILKSAAEVFLTNSRIGVMPVSQIEQHSYSTQIALKIHKEYERFCRSH